MRFSSKTVAARTQKIGSGDSKINRNQTPMASKSIQQATPKQQCFGGCLGTSIFRVTIIFYGLVGPKMEPTSKKRLQINVEILHIFGNDFNWLFLSWPPKMYSKSSFWKNALHLYRKRKFCQNHCFLLEGKCYFMVRSLEKIESRLMQKRIPKIQLYLLLCPPEFSKIDPKSDEERNPFCDNGASAQIVGN